MMSSILSLDIRSAIPVGKMPLSTGGSDYCVESMIVTGVAKTCQKDFTLIHLRFENRVPVYICVYNNRGRGGKDDPIIKHRNS